MLEGIVEKIVFTFNLLKISQATGGSFYSTANAVLVPPFPFGEGYPCYSYSFLYDNHGFLRELGKSDKFTKEKVSKYHEGKFIVAVDVELINAVKKTGVRRITIPHEKIVGMEYRKGSHPKIKRRFCYTAGVYNNSFSADFCKNGYDGFTVGDFLDNEPKSWFI